MTTTGPAEARGPRRRVVLVRTFLGWAASLVTLVSLVVLSRAVAEATGWLGFSGALAWLSIALVLGIPALPALAGTLVMPPAWLRGATGVMLHALVVLPVPVGFVLLAMTSPGVQLDTNVRANLFVTGLFLAGTFVGAVLGRLLRRAPHRLLRDSGEDRPNPSAASRPCDPA